MLRWLSTNWIWVVLVGGMLWMHLGMHGGHGGHGGGAGHGSHGEGTPQREADSTGASHRHRGC